MKAAATANRKRAHAAVGGTPAKRGTASVCRPLLAAFAMLLVASCAAATAIPLQSPSVTVSRLADDARGLKVSPPVELLAAYGLESRDPRFGGFSALETDGRTLWLLSDRAVLWQASLTLDARDGALMLADWAVGAVLPDPGARQSLDSEALARALDGTLHAAFEHDDSVRRLVPEASGDWSTLRLHDGKLLDGSPPNQGLEALAILADGSFLALSEGARRAPDIALGARLTEAGVEQFGYRTAAGFSPVGATAAGDHLFVLERSIGILAGWQSRLTRARLPDPPFTGVLEGEELLRINAGPLAENYEGIAILERPGEPSLILLVADDNQSALQRTLLLVFTYAG